MSSCISGGGRTYGFDIEIVKSSSPLTTTRTSQTSSSPSSTISESSNSPLTISTRKPRTARKRPNQTYNEAATLLSTVYPNIFSTKHLPKNNTRKFTKPHQYSSFFDDSSDPLLPFRPFHDDSGFLLHQPIQEKPNSPVLDLKGVDSTRKPWTTRNREPDNPPSNSIDFCVEYDDDFDAESILDEEIEEGIDSIMGNHIVNHEFQNDTQITSIGQIQSWYGNPMGLGLPGFGFGVRRGVSALRHVDEGNWWCNPTVDVLQISPNFNTTTSSSSATTTTTAGGGANKKKSSSEKKKKKVEKLGDVEIKGSDVENENSNPKLNAGLLLKLNYDEVLNAWSDRESPFSDETMTSDVAGNDLYAKLAQIDLFSDGGGVREASVLRYKEKRRTRLFSKKIRYQVRKVNADRRPRMKGRFVRRSGSNSSDR